MDYIEGYEHAPQWWIEQKEFDEYENYLVEIGYYENFDIITL